jgi:hypothetical protein
MEGGQLVAHAALMLAVHAWIAGPDLIMLTMTLIM